MKHFHAALQNYLPQYGEKITEEIAASLDNKKTFKRCLIIPVYQETITFFERLQRHKAFDQQTLLIVIINQPTSVEHCPENQQIFQNLLKKGSCKRLNGFATEITLKNSFSTIIVDCFQNGQRLPDKQGVGLARKIGFDLSGQLVIRNILKTKWIYTTDADTVLPDNYFHNNLNSENDSVGIFSFSHQGKQSDIVNATLLYEKSLQYYVKKLEEAGSPYAFQTLGSCLCINIDFYAKARGFPKRAGGEDFYLLNKLAKLGNIRFLDHCKLIIEARASDRVPFGTGPAVQKIIQDKNNKKIYTYYNPSVFIALKDLIKHFEKLREHQKHSDKWMAEVWLNALPSYSVEALSELQIEKLFKHIKKQNISENHIIKQCHDWFDAFKTLKFIHALEKTFGKEPIDKLIPNLEPSLRHWLTDLTQRKNDKEESVE